MNYLKKDYWRTTFVQRVGIFVLLLMLIGFEMALHFKSNVEKSTYFSASTSRYDSLEFQLSQLIDSAKTNGFTFHRTKRNKISKDSLRPFHPNDLPKQGWEKLGFTPKQAEVIMKYKQMLGGKFESKEQIRKCFVVSDEIYQILEPYILLPEKSKSDLKQDKYQSAKKINYTRFNPNEYTERDWIKIGFSPRQAEVILKYKKMVGGEFRNKDQLKKCFVISDDKYAEMEPYINLPEKNDSNFKSKDQELVESTIPTNQSSNQLKSNPSKVEITEKFNPNDLDLEGWIKLGFSEKQAQTILNFKRSLGGKFKDAKTLSRSYVISEEKFKEMEPYLVFE